MKKQPTEAEVADAQLSFEKRPTDFVAAYTYGMLLLVQGRGAEAEQPLRVAANSIEDTKGDAAELLATSLMLSGEFRQSAEAWSLVVRRRPDDEETLAQAASTWSRAGDMQKALINKRKLAQVRDSASGWADLGATLSREGLHPEAVDAFDKAKKKDPAFFDNAPYEASMWKKSKESQQ